jgi:hypothetical protein
MIQAEPFCLLQEVLLSVFQCTMRHFGSLFYALSTRLGSLVERENEVGTYRYVCPIRASESGVVVVLPPPAGASCLTSVLVA